MERPRIALLEPDPSHAARVRELVAYLGYELLPLRLEHGADDAVRGHLPLAMVLTNAGGQGYTGIELCEDLKMGTGTGNVPIVVIVPSGGGQQAAREALEAGADGFIESPVSECALRAWINVAVRVASLQSMQTGAARDGGYVFSSEAVELFTKLSHAVNHPLQVVRTSAEMIGDNLPPEHPSRKYLASILNATDRASAMVREASQLAKRATRT